MPGPRKKDPESRRRRNMTPGFRQLPPEGRSGETPEWPFDNPDLQELVKWETLWRLPQAVEWERIGCHDIVALYVRIWFQLQQDFDQKLISELRQLDVKIGLSPKSMADLHWEVAEPKQERESQSKTTQPSRAYVPKLSSVGGTASGQVGR